uniref:Reverse transcriptase N-terminal domain-containing protein n=1 Tax=Dictyurus purpurascens TaxID=189649 RepID=A0A4D6WSF1_9FLOR|nr:hypothetical protein [Dictyurus purpurascens]
MSYNYKFNSNTKWSNLPWKYIFSKVFILQKKIYKSAKKCDLNNVLKLQQYLINSNEAKILSIQYIINQLYLHYICHNNTKYIITDKKKYKIFKFLFKQSKNISFNLVLKIVEEYLLYLCLEPELESKYPIFIYKKNSSYYYYINKLYKIGLLKFNSEINVKCKFLMDNLKKINQLKYIIKYFQYRFYYSFYNNLINYQKILSYYDSQKVFINKNNYINLLYSSFINISKLGLDWYTFYINRSCTLKKNIIFTYNIQIKYYYYHNLIIKILKFFINKRNILKVLKIFEILKNCSDIIFYLDNELLKTIYLIINSMMYFLSKKIYKNIFIYHKNTKNINVTFNNIFYKIKMKNFYMSY